MTGWLCLWRDDAAPVAAALIDSLHATLRPRGPHGDTRALCGNTVLLQSALLTGPAAAAAPVRIGPYVAVGDVFLEDRAAVARAVALEPAHASVSDLELLVRAYLHFGESVVAHVGGEYSACIVDGRSREALLVRDAFGVRQLFFSRRGRWLVASNAIEAVRAHPDVRAALDDAQVIDFLLFEATMDKDRTVFADVDRVPPGYLLHVNSDSTRRVCSFALSPPAVDHRSSLATLAARWRGALDDAVAARAPAAVTVFLSGGLDSTAVAASLRARAAVDARLAAITGVPSRGPDEDGRLAASVAAHLQLSHRFVANDVRRGSDVLAFGPMQAPLLTHDPFDVAPTVFFSAAAAHGPVALHGEGGDELWRYGSVRNLVKSRGPLGTAVDVMRALKHGVRPYFATGLLARAGAPVAGGPPPWIATALKPLAAERFALQQPRMWHARFPATHERALAVAALETPLWTDATFELDASATQAPLTIRLPLLDRRVVREALRAPVLPAAANKTLVREAMRDRLPAEVVHRKKSGLPFDQLGAAGRERSRAAARAGGEAGRFVDVPRLAEAFAAAHAPDDLWIALRATSLARFVESL